MTLIPGTRLGPYEISTHIGAGGMGEVYRATDSNLKRSVAIKVLPASVATDTDRLARFQREAEVLAALNHPNIAAIYGLEKTPEITGLVMEFVDGEDLSAHIARGAMPLAESLPIARQIADALEAAHEHGIIHRDLKPANVKVRADGTVKVLDFGLAKSIAEVAGQAERAETAMLTSPAMTQAGMILGTAAYMAPEQARGRPLDRRADIWAFGVVLFEMLTGRRAFPGDDVTDTIVSVVSKEPDWSALPEATPAALRRLVARCLKKDPKARLRDIGEARVQIDEMIGGAPDDAIRAPVSTPPPVAPKWRALPWAIAGLALLAAGFMAVRNFRGAPASPAPRLMRVSLPFGTATAEYGVVAPGIAISTDGATIVYSGRTSDGIWKLFLRRLNEPEPRFIRGTEGGSAPFLSPMADWVGFWTSDGHLKKVAIDGGIAVTLADMEDLRGASWGADGFIVYTPNIQEGLWRVSEKGGTPPERLTTRDAAKHEKTHRMPDVLPDGKGVLFMIGTTEVDSWNDGIIAVLPPGGAPPKVLLKGGMMPRYAAGHLVYASGGDLLAAPFDLDRLEVTGPAMSITSDVAMISAMGTAEAAVSSGALAYLPGRLSVSLYSLIEADRSGLARKLSDARAIFNLARWLPDHVRVLAGVDTGNTSAWMFDTSRNAPSRVTFHNDVTALAWNRVTSRVIYAGVGQILSAALDGNGRDDVILTDAGFLGDLDVSSDGQFVVFTKAVGTIFQLWMLNTSTGKAEPWLPARFSQAQPRFSTDGRWVTYTSTESNVTQVFARAAHGVESRVAVSTGFGINPVWSSDGREIFYSDRKDVWVASVRGAATDHLEIDKPRRLFTMPERSVFLDVKPDTQHFLLAQSEPLPSPAAITYITGWLDLIKGKAPAGR